MISRPLLLLPVAATTVDVEDGSRGRERFSVFRTMALSATFLGWWNFVDGAQMVLACPTVYLAKSSIPDAGWGVFAARDYNVGDFIGTPSIGIPFLDFSVDPEDSTFIYGGLSEYLWESSNIGGFGEAGKVDIFLPGPASLVNHHAGLENVYPAGLHHDDTFHRHDNPMAGSFSAYSTTSFAASSNTTKQYSTAKGTLVVTRSIRAGDELFVDKTRQPGGGLIHYHAAYVQELPLAQDYEVVDAMVQAIAQEGYYDTLTPAQFHDLLHRLAVEIIPAGNGGGSGGDSRRHPTTTSTILQQLFPRSQREFQRCLKEGSAKYRLLTRNLNELEQEGHCMDTITLQPSTILGAGQGAFSTRSLPRGSIVSLAPLVTITNGPMAMRVPYTAAMEHNPPVSNKDTLGIREHNATEQLLLNYCLGHAESDMLFCPTTQAVLMNHAPRTKTPNVGVRWYHDPDTPEYDQWILQSWQDVTSMDASNPKTLQSRLAMEYVALRDILEGEELLLDYSSPWQEALVEHLQHGQSSAATATTTRRAAISAKTWNDEYRPILPSIEILSMGVAYFCHVFPNVKIDDDASSVEWEDFSANAAVDQDNWPPEFLNRYQDNEFASLYPCIVVGQSQYEGYYSVEMLVKPLSLSQVAKRFVNIPRDRIRFVDSLFRSDMHLEWAFRHYVPIPDSIFPMQWRRDYKSANDFQLGRYLDGQPTRAEEESYERSLREASCGLYLAPSNIPGAGFGVYTGVDVPVAGIAITTRLPVIPAMTGRDQYHWMGKDYVWSSRFFYASYLEGWPLFETAFISFLFGALANAHAGINNIEHDMGEWEPLLDAATEPGAGAFTDYVNTAFRSVYPIKKGEELFVSYGEDWFRHRPNFSDVPLSENFRRANYVVASIWAFLSGSKVDDIAHFLVALLSIIRERVVDQTDLRTISVLKDIHAIDDLRHVMKRGGTAEVTVQARSEEWLTRNGYCLDHIYVAESSIPFAGRGGFSRRHLSKDSVIIASPALVTPRAVLSSNRPDINGGDNELHLLTNYHFGHPNSSVLFFPLVTSAFFNHASNDRQPNARFQFSSTDKRSLYFQSLPLEDLLEQRYSTIMIDFIATRDIEPDEEILIDYGNKWGRAWSDYIKNWISPCPKEASDTKCHQSSKRVKAMNYDKFNSDFHLWSDVHITTCHYNQTLIEEYGEITYIIQDFPSEFGLAVDPFITLEYEGIDFFDEGFNLPRFTLESVSHYGVACKILSSTIDSDSFDVVYLIGDTDDLEGAKAVWRVREVPSSYVMFHHRPLQSDMMRPGAFRHEIAFPDNKFPKLWRDIGS